MNREFLGYDANGQELYEGDMAKPIGNTSFSDTHMIVRALRDDEQYIAENAPGILKAVGKGFVMVKPINGWPEPTELSKTVAKAILGEEMGENYKPPHESMWAVNMLERVDSVEGSVH